MDDDLAAAGLNPAETAAYEHAIARPGSTMRELAGWWTRPEPLPDVLAGLEEKGLVTADDGIPPRYTAVDPAVALAAPLLNYDDRLQRARARVRELADRHRARPATVDVESVAEVVNGRRAVRQQLLTIQAAARDELWCLDKPLGDDGLRGLEPSRLRAGVRSRMIYEPASLERSAGTAPWPTARVLPALPMWLCLADRRYAMLPLQTDPAAIEAAVIVHESALLETLVKLFDGLWERALPLPGPGPLGAATPARDPAGDEQRLLALLLSGLSDTAIARQLGVAHRTVQRRVAALMHSLGAYSRFQIGIQVAIRDRTREPVQRHQ